MKKFLAVLITLAMLVTLTACGENEEKGDNSKKYTDYEKLIEDVMEAFEDGDEDVIEGMITDLMQDHYKAEIAEYVIDDYEDTYDGYKVRGWEIFEVDDDEDMLEELIEDIEDELDNFNEMLDNGEIDRDDLDDYGINLNFKPSKYKKYIVAEIKVELKDEDGDDYVSYIDFDIVKEGSEWRLCDAFISSPAYDVH